MRRNDFRTAGRDSESSELTPNGATPQQMSNTRSTFAARITHAARRALKEPLVHFLALGVALFAANAYVPQSGIAASTPKQIVLTLDELRQLEMVFQSQWRRQPTPRQFDALVETKVKEEILYREAVAIGLDKDDEIVKRRMAQKMQFLAEDVAAAHEPSRTELRTWFTANAEKFALPGRVSFRHLYFSPDQRGSRARDDAAAALTKLDGQPIDSPLAVGDATLLQEYYGDRAAEQLAKDFGPVFAQATFELAPGSWQGPIESGFGWHLVFVDSLVPGRVRDFEEVESDVKTAWLGEQKALAWQKAYDALRAKYVVLLPRPPEDASPGPAQ
jgi:peptidyl-prolyl cis-trans isomerase C